MADVPTFMRSDKPPEPRPGAYSLVVRRFDE
jgi:hypothetical protein